MEKRYTALRIIGTIYKILGIIAGVITILALLGTCAATVWGGAFLEQISNEMYQLYDGAGFLGSALGGVMISILLVMYGGGLAVTLYALGEGGYLMLSIEENTRATAILLARQAPPPPNP